MAVQYLGETSKLDPEEKVKSIVSEMLKSKITPPRFNGLLAALASANANWIPTNHLGMPITAVVSEADRSLVARRFLAVLSKADGFFPKAANFDPPDYLAVLKRRIFEMLVSMGEKSTGSVIEEWYRVEPTPASREVVVDSQLSWSKSAEWAGRRKAILSLAEKDWDEGIAKKAKALLAEADK